METVRPLNMRALTPDVKSPVLQKIEELHARYDSMFNEVMDVMKKYKCGPIEIWRVANELQTHAFETSVGNLGTYIDARLGQHDTSNTGSTTNNTQQPETQDN